MSADIYDFLSSPQVDSILLTHPNRLFSSTEFCVPSEWSSWWNWAGLEEDELSGPKWLLLLRYYARSQDGNQAQDWISIPEELKSIIDRARRMQVSREMDGPVVLSVSPSTSVLALVGHDQDSEAPSKTPVRSEDRIFGMSPKKAHEIIRMSSFLSKFLSSSPQLASVKHAVDVGAGQAYLSRAMRDKLGLHVLALDWSDVQSKGAVRRETIGPKKWKRRSSRSANDPVSDANMTGESQNGPPACEHAKTGTLTYKTLEIRSDSLLCAVNEWAEEVLATQGSDASSPPVPMLFVALHACGSLTPNVLRAFTSRLRSTEPRTIWVPRAAVIVGCCYNLLEAGDFPLSCTLKLRSHEPPAMTFTPNHLHLAAQMPGQWLRTQDTLSAAKLAVRKVVWRAVLQSILEKHDASSVQTSSTNCDADLDETAIINGETPALRRLGRLNDSAYADWETFVGRAQHRLGIMLDPALCAKDPSTESRLEVFQVLRCILGPVVESLILLDREEWLRDELEGTSMNVQLVNLFDQASGSARNVAIVITPRATTHGG
ncbi:methyltransferase domain-containing protein [Fomitopsis serialis]|uniref:methyltransferase domain-containing protein n=1 Tax=Fomitopsis serialis TaxID=139415 RepID=UPI002007B434|nr:methyltransferase domain-containing protein [Neoantrodia serialis]KAH9922652.1 methyltransferase domain-containing protein [Neoantrodia serialis]